MWNRWQRLQKIATSNVTGHLRGPKRKLRAGYRALLLKRTSCCGYFSSSSVVLHAFSALCVYLKFGHHPHPLGYLCAKFSFFHSLHCWASPWRKITYSHNHSINHSINHPAYLMPQELLNKTRKTVVNSSRHWLRDSFLQWPGNHHSVHLRIKVCCWVLEVSTLLLVQMLKITHRISREVARYSAGPWCLRDAVRFLTTGSLWSFLPLLVGCLCWWLWCLRLIQCAVGTIRWRVLVGWHHTTQWTVQGHREENSDQRTHGKRDLNSDVVQDSDNQDQDKDSSLRPRQ